MRIMLDTNIIVSAGVFGGAWTTEMTLKIADKYNIVISSTVINELQLVMEKKFIDKMPALEHFLERLSYEIAYTPTEIDENIYPLVRDKKDYPILASAILSDVDVFLTEDKDFDGINLERPEIMRLNEFSKKYM